MAFNPQRLKKAFYTFSSIFKKQAGFGTAIADGDLDDRHNCTVTFDDVKERETIYDCEQSDVYDEEVTAQLKRVTLNYASITPQRLFGWVATLLSAAAAPTGTPANEVQTITINATGGTFTIAFSFEGKSGVTSALAWNAEAAVVQAALENLSSIGSGNVSVSLAGLIYTITFQGDLQKANVSVVTTNAASLTGGTGTAVAATTTQGANKYHASTRSTDDQLVKISFGCGYEGNVSEDPLKFYNQAVESITINIQRRKLVTAAVVLVGRFTPSEMASYVVPACDNLPGLKGRYCKIKINGQYLGEEFWAGTITLNNAPPTGDDAFPFDDLEVSTLERGDKPTYPVSMQILGSEGDTLGELCRLESKVPVEFLLGKPGDRCSLIFPNVKMKFQSNPRPYVGELNRSAHGIDAMPHKDATLLAPLRAEAYLDQTETFLTS